MHYLTAAITVNNCGTYLPEWLEFHIMQGFQHFLIYDHYGTDNTRELLDQYIKEGFVTIIDYPKELYNKASGLWALSDMINRSKKRTKWLMMASLDEFLFRPTGGRVIDILPEFEQYAGIAIQWMLYNADGQDIRNPGLVIERFTTTYDENPLHCKSLIQPDRITGFYNPHAFRPAPGFIVVDENKQHQPSAHPQKFTANILRLNHYWTLSKEEYDRKMGIGRNDQAGGEGRYRDNYMQNFINVNAGIPRHDTILSDSPYPKAIREHLAKRYKPEEFHMIGLQHPDHPELWPKWKEQYHTFTPPIQEPPKRPSHPPI